jgi:hypothetical protein
MVTLVNILILFFIILICFQILLANNSVEGLENNTTNFQPYDTNNPANALILAQQNAGNIVVLKQQLDGMLGLNKEVQDLSGNVVKLQDQLTGLILANQQYTAQMVGTTPPQITGAV